MAKKNSMFNFQPLVTLEAEFRAKIEHEGNILLKAETAKLFEKFPELSAVSFVQYTPYFCDGDVCEFGLHGVYAKLKNPTPTTSTANPGFADVEDEIEEDSGDWLDSYELKGKSNAKEALDQLEGSLESILDSLEIIFGDSVRVIITREGVETEEYEHE